MINNRPMAVPEFSPGEDVMALVYHPPEIQPGTRARIVKPWFGSLCVVRLPDGMLHRWFASFELRPVNFSTMPLLPGSYAEVISTTGHPPHIKQGTVVQIVKCMTTTFYDLTLSNGMYHRWLAEFELARPV